MNIKTLLGSSLQRRRRIVNQLDICVIISQISIFHVTLLAIFM